MAAMTTALTKFSENGNSRTSTTTGHSAIAPKIVVERRRVPDQNQKVAEYAVKVVHSTTDAEGLTLQEKVSFEGIVRFPINGQTSTITAALAIFRDVIAGDEFGASSLSQNYLKP